MKHIRLLSALLVIGGATVAAAQQTQQAAPHAHGQRGQMGPRRGPGGPGMQGVLLRGLTLTDAEKANLKAVHQKYAAQTKALREQFKPQHEAMRTARQNHDSTALKNLWQQNTAEREATKKLMDAQRNDLRAALSAVNQAKFDANAAKLEKRLAAHPDAEKKFRRRPGKQG